MTAARPSHPGPPHLRQLTSRVFAYLQPDGGWCLNNAGVVLGDGEVLLVDTAATESRALALRDAVRSLDAGPVRTVVNTHHHGDHTHGNYVFADTARILGHERLPAELMAQGRMLEQLWPYVQWGRIDLKAPDTTYDDTMRLDVGDVAVELVHIPAAHTTNDTVVWLPDEGVLFTGDIVFSGGTPFVMMGSITGSLAALDRLRGFGAQVVVSGHGPVGAAALFDATERYLLWLQQVALRARARSRSPLEAAREADLGEFRTLGEPERIAANLRRAYAELDGVEPAGPIDLAGAIADMASFGGKMPECLA